MRSFKGLLLLVCVSVFVLPLAAQKITGTITGVVTDQAGAVVSGADVTADQSRNGEVRTAKTGAGGDYVIPDLPAGTYDVSVKQANFKEYVSKGVQLFVSSTATVNAMLDGRQRDRADDGRSQRRSGGNRHRRGRQRH